jgi:phage tail tape-measure protein
MLNVRSFAVLMGAAVTMVGCVTPAQRGAVGGGLVGAGLGAIIGDASGSAGVGALIGAGVGAATGAIIGDQVDHDRYGYAPHSHYAPPPAPVYYAPPPAPAPAPTHFSRSYRVETGHYEVRLVKGASGEYYEERVWVP